MSLNSPLITLEEHYLTRAVADYLASVPDQAKLPETQPGITTLLRDLETTRLSSMNSSGVSLQILSHPANPIPIPPSVCTAANDEIAAAIASCPTPQRFRAFALLPTAHPAACPDELARCINTHHFVGSLVDNTTDAKFYDSPRYHPLFAAHVSLNVPLYLHPSMLPEATPLLYAGNYPPSIASFLSNQGFGWHASTALHILRLYAARTFDLFPTLQIILGHMGEMLPFQLDRISRLTGFWPDHDRPRRSFLQVWHENVYLTTSGMFSLAPMACVLRATRVDRVMFSVDYPFAKNEGVEFMQELKSSGLVSEKEWEMIAYGNAERVLGVTASKRTT